MHQEIIQHKIEQSQSRTDDYKVLVKSLYANAQSVQVYGGEDAATPDYNKVYISIRAKSGSNLTELTKTNLVKSLKSFAVASVTPVIIDPETTFITLTTTFKYDSSLTTKDYRHFKQMC